MPKQAIFLFTEAFRATEGTYLTVATPEPIFAAGALDPLAIASSTVSTDLAIADFNGDGKQRWLRFEPLAS